MIAELDPDLRLHARLALGGGWRRALLLATWAAAFALLWLSTTGPASHFVPFDSGEADPGFLAVALIALMFGPARAVVRLLDLERNGLLDQTRLCGRPPYRVLTVLLAGSTWPYVAFSLMLLAGHLRFQGEPASLLLALVAFAGAIDISLLAYGMFPRMTTDSRSVSVVVLLLAVAAATYLRTVGWAQRLTVGDPRALATIGLVAATLPVAVRIIR